MGRGERKLKGKGCERRLSASIMNSPSAFAWVGLATMLAQAVVTHHGIYIQRVCTVYDHVYNVPIVQGNPISRMLAECPISQCSCGC